MRKLVRILGAASALAGAALLIWTITVWRWQEPLTYFEAKRAQAALARRYAHEPRLPSPRGFHPRHGDPVGRLLIPKLGLKKIVVYGTDASALDEGPGLDPRSHLPGEGELAYVAGHRTTHGAPFSHIDELRRGDLIVFELPYGTFRYRVTHRKIVLASDLSVLRSHGFEELALQACWPRFFASHRIVVFARPVRGR